MDLLEDIEKNGFLLTRRKQSKILSDSILIRYKNIPAEYLNFLQSFEKITNKENTSWFNSIEDFNGETETDFVWNAFELMSLEAFEGDDDEQGMIRKFWDNHIPILMSVKEYEYLAICLSEDKYGEIVHGCEPEFEETSKVCDSLKDFISILRNPVNNECLAFFK